MKFRQFKRLRDGFSLIEVNMAIFVLAGGALALLGLFPLGLRESLAARNEMRVAAFGERFISAARIASADPEVKSVSALQDKLTERPFDFENILDNIDGLLLSNIPFNYSESDGVYYCAWVIKDPDMLIDNSDDGQRNVNVYQAGVMVTTENAKTNDAVKKYSSTYAVKVILEE